MKTLLLSLSLLATQTSFAQMHLSCKNADGAIELIQTNPCKNCEAPAFSFIGGDNILSDGIPAYDATMPGYISADSGASKDAKQDVISLIDGGTWWLSVYLPQGFLSAPHTPGEAFKATMDSSYSDIMDSELNDIDLDCTVL